MATHNLTFWRVCLLFLKYSNALKTCLQTRLELHISILIPQALWVEIGFWFEKYPKSLKNCPKYKEVHDVWWKLQSNDFYNCPQKEWTVFWFYKICLPCLRIKKVHLNSTQKEISFFLDIFFRQFSKMQNVKRSMMSQPFGNSLTQSTKLRRCQTRLALGEFWKLG